MEKFSILESQMAILFFLFKLKKIGIQSGLCHKEKLIFFLYRKNCDFENDIINKRKNKKKKTKTRET